MPLFFAFLLGALSVASFAPLGWFWLIWLTLGAFFAQLNALIPSHPCTPQTLRQATRRAAFMGAMFGAGLFCTGVSWVYISLSTFGEMSRPLAAVSTLLFCVFLALYPALASALFVRFAPQRRSARCVFFAALWMLSEWLRGWLLTGFPWLAVGYAQVPSSSLAGFAPLLGVYGVSFLCALHAALLATGLSAVRQASAARRQSAQWIKISAYALAILVLHSGGFLPAMSWTSAQGAPISVSLLQGNIAQDIKWRPENLGESMLIYYRLAQENPAQLIVFPETAIPAFDGQIPRTFRDDLKALAQSQRGDILFGAILGNHTHYGNGAISIGQSPEQRYTKSHLVPFGEFIPAGFRWLLAQANIPMSSFTAGDAQQPPMRLAGQTLAVNICYEDAFGEEIIRALPEAKLLVNLSNLAWFGDSLAPAQHLQMAQTRALESGRVMLRATNTGMTAIIGPDGRVQKKLAPFTQGALRGVAQPYSGATPYVRLGNVPSVLIASLLVLFFLALARRRRA